MLVKILKVNKTGDARSRNLQFMMWVVSGSVKYLRRRSGGRQGRSGGRQRRSGGRQRRSRGRQRRSGGRQERSVVGDEGTQVDDSN